MDRPKTRVPLFLMFVAAAVLVAALAFGETPSKPLSETEVVDLLQSRMKQVDEQHDLDDATKGKVKDLYQQALGEMAAVKRWTEKGAEFERLAAEAPESLKKAKRELAEPPAQPAEAIPDQLTLPQIEQQISKREAELDKRRKALSDDETELKGRSVRRAKVPEQIGAAKERLADINSQLQAAASGDDGTPAGLARRALLAARRRTAEREIACCEKELRAYEARSELLPASRDLDARQVALGEQQLKAWQDAANRRRKQEAEQQARQAMWQAGQAHPLVRTLAEQNAELAGQRKSLASSIAETTARLAEVNDKLATLKDNFNGVQQKVDTVGLSDEIGLLLRKHRESLPNLRELRRNAALRRRTIGEGQLVGLRLDDERRQLTDLEAATQAELEQQRPIVHGGDGGDLTGAVRQALSTRRDYLDALIHDNDIYYKKLVELHAAEQQLVKETERDARFIDERVLWIASTAPLTAADVRCAGDALWWLAGPRAWLDIGRTLVADAWQNRVISLLATGIFLLLVYWRRRFRARVQRVGEKAARGSCYRFLPTLEVCALTTLMAAVWPGLVWYVGWRLGTAASASELCKAAGAGLGVTAGVYFVLELLRHTCDAGGLGEAHFGWTASAAKLVRHNLRWLSLVVLPLVCVAAALRAHAAAMSAPEAVAWDSALGRACFVAALLGFALFVERILRPGGAVLQALVAARRGGWIERLRYVWYPLGVMIPGALAILAAAGYYYTAQQLAARLVVTTYALVGVIVLRAVLLRWTLVNQRKLAIEQARQRRATALEAAGGDEPSAADLPTAADEKLDLATINTQTRRLVEYALAVACALALWCTWTDVLPALGTINVDLWPTTATVLQKGTSFDGQAIWRAEERPCWITLADVCLAVIVLSTTVIAAKNIPGLLEMAVLQHLPVDAGARYAVATVCRYLITLVGVLLCCMTLGVGWSKVQWLVAAMSLGLGFGLQEIFANFVSGLIILIERPIRVRDIVTIDGVTGVVTRIRMRATTITDGDRKELVVPNKEFITGRVLNWTLSDPVNRVVIRVGIAYGSDTRQAAEILLRIARQHDIVLHDPPPAVSLESFGDSALNFVLRCFLPNMDNRGTVIHELHMAIDREFRAASIEIAFPQQDVHVRSIDLPLPLAAQRPWPPAEEAA